MNDGAGFFASIVLAFLCAAFAFAQGLGSGEERAKKEAVSKGVAEFVATPEGKVEFRWKKPCK